MAALFAALLLPLAVAQEPIQVTIQVQFLSAAEVPKLEGARIRRLPQMEGITFILADASKRTVEKFESWLKSGKAHAMSAPVVRTLSGQEAKITTNETIAVEGGHRTLLREFAVNPTVRRDGRIDVDFSVIASVGEDDHSPRKIVLNSRESMRLKNGGSLFMVTTPKSKNPDKSFVTWMRVSRVE